MSIREMRILGVAAFLIASAFISGRWSVGDPVLSCRRDIVEARRKRDEIRQQPVGIDTVQTARRTLELAESRRRIEELEYICGR